MERDHGLSEHERAAVAQQVDYFIEVLSQRYGLTPMEVVETVRWVRDRKEFLARARMSGAMSLLGLVIAAMAVALWEGVKAMLNVQTRT